MSVKLRAAVTIAAAAALLTAPAVAQATLTFVRNPLKPAVWVAADDGTGAHRVASGTNPRVSPDGQTIAYLHTGGKNGELQELVAVNAAEGSIPRTLMVGWREPFVFAWSPDSTTIAALRGPELGSRRLVLIDVASGSQSTVASGFFGGVSFAPKGGQLVFSKGPSENFPPRSDVYRFDIPIGEPVRYVPPVRLTQDHRSTSPLWGPNGKIAFVKLLGGKKRRYGPKNELYLMGPEGGKVRRLTHTEVGPLLQGLTPTQWSADGRRLLAEFGGQDTSYAVTVNPRTGAQRPLTKEREMGLVGTALSSDGLTVLGAIGGFEPGPRHKVVTIPYTGGKQSVLAPNASEPAWSR